MNNVLNGLPYGRCTADRNPFMQKYPTLKPLVPLGSIPDSDWMDNNIKKHLEPDKILFNGEVVKSSIKNYTGQQMTEMELFPSSERDYTVGDAVNYRYNKEFTLNLEDILEGNYEDVKLRPQGPVPQEFIDGLKEKGIQEDSYDSFWSRFYIGGLSGEAELGHNVDYLASGYAVARQKIEKNFTGEEREKALSRLTEDFDKAAGQVADRLADELGGFFQENGVEGEAERIRDSVIKAYEDRVETYSGFIKSGTDYAGVAGTENAWLEIDSSYMACQLRKAVEVKKDSEKGDYYSISDLTKTRDMVREIRSQAQSCGDNGIRSSSPEEYIGLKLGEMALKGEVFAQYSGVSHRLKDAVKKSISNITETITDRLNESLREERKTGIAAGLWADMDREEIFAVYDKIMDTYKVTGDMLEALKKGKEYADSRVEEKKSDPRYSCLGRYHGNQRYDSGELADSWNGFVTKLTHDSSLIMTVQEFSAIA